MVKKRSLVKFLAANLLFAPLISSAQPSGYPNRPIRLIVPYSAGGAVDMVGRAYAQQLSEALNQPVTVENRPGASAMIGIKAVQQAPADGYTLLMSTTTFSTNPIVYKAPGYSLDEFSVVSGLGVTGLLLLANSNVPVKSYAELVAYGKANPKKLNMGVLGGGGITQLLTSRFENVSGIETTEVTYKGGAPAMQDLLAGIIDLYIDPMPTAVPQLSGGKVKALATTTEQRSALLPEVPTFKELGVPAMMGGAWFAVHASAKTPPAILSALRQQSTAMMGSKVFRDKLVSLKVDPWNGSLDRFVNFLREDKLLWEQDAKRSGLTGTL